MTTCFGHARRGSLLVATALLIASAWTAAAAAAPSTDHADNGRHLGQTALPVAAGAGTGHATKSHPRHPHAHPNAHANVHAQANAAKHGAPGAQAAGTRPQAAPTIFGAGDPPGNNGTVKIAGLGDLDGIPNNVAHPGCTFEVQWYGFDAGSDVVSTVSFTPWTPTAGVSMAVSGPTQVPVGQDAASGAGTTTGLDAVATYTLTFSGAPATQGYHVRLTVSTPRSLGKDTKTKMFWVAPCQAASSGAAAPAAVAGMTTSDSVSPQAEQVVAGAPVVDSISAAPARAMLRAAPAPARVPTVIDAGAHPSLLHRLVGSPWGLPILIAGLLIVTAGACVTLRARRHV